jgi:hypothetical protein
MLATAFFIIPGRNAGDRALVAPVSIIAQYLGDFIQQSAMQIKMCVIDRLKFH